MRTSPAFTIIRERRRADGSVQLTVRKRGGRIVSVHVPAGNVRDDVMIDLLDAACRDAPDYPPKGTEGYSNG